MNKINPEASTKSGLSCAVIGLLGCGVVALLGFVLVGALGYYGFRVLNEKIEEFAAPFEEEGYRRVTGQVVVENQTVEQSKVYAVQVLKLEDGASADLAIMAQVAEIHGTVDGDIEFFGQVLEIKEDAVVKGNIHAQAAQVIKIRGTVEGEITGTYQALDQRGAASVGKKTDGKKTDGKKTEAPTDVSTEAAAGDASELKPVETDSEDEGR